ncbi:MAG: hypothetical protein ACLUOI_21435 [Eisenbergiella sp.]
MVEGSIKGVAAQCPKVIAQTSLKRRWSIWTVKKLKRNLIPSYAVTLEQAKETMNEWQ